MKPFITTLVFILSYFQNFGQVNLVSNPSFEDTVICPTILAQVYASSNWKSYGQTPDFFNSCSSTGTNVPYSTIGFQNAHSGIAMMGLIPYRNPTSPNGPNYREFIGTRLTSPLQFGTQYFISFYVNFANYHPFQAVASNKIGVNLFTVPFDSSNAPPLNNSAKLFSSDVLYDSTNWVKISGSFIADSAYEYLSIGNFFDDSNTDTISLSSFPDASYYYIDDVCLTSDSLYNENWTDISNVNESSIVVSIYPNPSYGVFHLQCATSLDELQLYNPVGKLVLVNAPKKSQFELNLNDLPKGIYFLRALTKNVSVKKIIILTN